MADFKMAFDITSNNEGGYTFNPSDTGGETVFGISRKNWPNWAGWKYIDQIKETAKTPHEIDHAIAISATPIHVLVDSFYRVNFWAPLQLDFVNDQQIANQVYDFGVNAGIGRSAKFLQQAAGVNADGKIGPVTIKAVNAGQPETIYNAFQDLRKAFYETLAEKLGQHQFLSSWLSRLTPYKNIT